MSKAARHKLSGGSPARRVEIGKERRARTRKRMLDSAARVLAERGDHGLTVETLIAEAGVSRGTFYNYWDSREELMSSLWRCVGHNPFHAMQVAHDEFEDPVERLSIMARHAILRAAGDATWGWLVICIAESPEIEQHELFSYPGEDLREAISCKRVQCEHYGAARDLIVGTTIAGMRQALLYGIDEDYVAAIVCMMLRALGLTKRESSEITRSPLPKLKVPEDLKTA